MFILKKNIKRIVAGLRFLGPTLHYRGVRILMYHSVGGSFKDHPLAIRVPEDAFKAQLQYLVDSGYRSLTVTEAIENMNRITDQKVIVLTFDDGYNDNFTFVLKKLKEMNFKATFFVSTSYINQECNKRWLNGFPREYMTWEEVISLKEAGFEIGSHMVHHCDLTHLNDPDIRFELTRSKEIIREKTKVEVKVFSYPYGRVNQKIIAIAKESGYIGACSSYSGLNQQDVDKYMLKRTEIDGCDSLKDFRSKLQGFYD